MRHADFGQPGARGIVLIGMPGAGKTTLSRALGEATGRPVVETDDMVEARAGMPVRACLDVLGEAAFRRLETQALREAVERPGAVISTGGGCVTVAENRALLRRGGLVVWIERDLALLSVEGRPLSLGEGVAALYRRREPLYRALADARVENNGTVAGAVRALLALWKL